MLTFKINQSSFWAMPTQSRNRYDAWDYAALYDEHIGDDVYTVEYHLEQDKSTGHYVDLWGIVVKNGIMVDLDTPVAFVLYRHVLTPRINLLVLRDLLGHRTVTEYYDFEFHSWSAA